MRWLLVKDLRILRRSPLLVSLLVIYPIVIAVLIGFALSRGPDKPEVAFYNGLSEGGRESSSAADGSTSPTRAGGCSTPSTRCGWTAAPRRSRRCATATCWARS